MKTEPIGTLKKIIKSKAFPFSVVFEVTNSCNLHCLHCYSRGEGEELGLDEIKRILADLDRAGCMKLTLTGGEPTLRKDFGELLSYCHQRGFATTLFTNATFTSTGIKEALLEGPLLAVETSLYGGSSGTHDAVTGVRGSFERTMENIRWMKEKKLRVIARSVLLTRNVHEINELYELTHNLGVDFHATFRVFPSLNPGKSPERLRVRTEDIQSFFKRDRHVLTEERMGPDAELKEFLCSAGKNSCCISAEGKVYPCAAFRWECGDLKVRSFPEIWKESPVLDKIRLYTEEDFKECSRCRLKQHCDFCPGMGYFEHGDMLIPSRELCRVTEALHE